MTDDSFVLDGIAIDASQSSSSFLDTTWQPVEISAARRPAACQQENACKPFFSALLRSAVTIIHDIARGHARCSQDRVGPSTTIEDVPDVLVAPRGLRGRRFIVSAYLKSNV